MARSRPALAKAVTEILLRHGTDGKRLSYRQAERVTGLSPATIGEMAKGNARTAETVRRFAAGLDEDSDHLLLLAGFEPDIQIEASAASPTPEMMQSPGSGSACLAPDLEPGDAEGRLAVQHRAVQSACSVPDGELGDWLLRFANALAHLPSGRIRDLWRERFQKDVELIEAQVEQHRQSLDKEGP